MKPLACFLMKLPVMVTVTTTLILSQSSVRPIFPRLSPTVGTDAAAPLPLPLGTIWRFFGDSQTAGAAEESKATSHAVAMRNVWQGSFGQPWPTVTVHGAGGCSLAQSIERYANLTQTEKRDTTFVHFQESGNQQIDGQRTAEEFAATFETFVRTVSAGSPSAIISYETAYSFQREALAGRNWNPYNVALREKIDFLRGQGFTIFLTDTDAKVKELVATLGFGTVIKADGGHYRGNGNLLIALSILNTLGYDVSTLSLSLIPDDQVTPAHKQLCVSIAADTPPTTLQVCSPNGGESWRKGQTQEITWSTTGATGPLVIELLQNGSLQGTIATNLDPATGSYTWTVGRLADGTFRSGTNLKIRIRTTSDTAHRFLQGPTIMGTCHRGKGVSNE